MGKPLTEIEVKELLSLKETLGPSYHFEPEFIDRVSTAFGYVAIDSKDDKRAFLCAVCGLLEEHLQWGPERDTLRIAFSSGLAMRGSKVDYGLFHLWFSDALEQCLAFNLIKMVEHDEWCPGMSSGSGYRTRYTLTFLGKREAQISIDAVPTKITHEQDREREWERERIEESLTKPFDLFRSLDTNTSTEIVKPKQSPALVSDRAINKLATEESRVDGDGQDEELEGVLAQLRPSTVEGAPSRAKIAAMILEARAFFFDDKPASQQRKVKRNHFWYLLSEDKCEPSTIRSVWNKSLTEEIRESLGDKGEVAGLKNGLTNIRNRANDHREKLELFQSRNIQ